MRIETLKNPGTYINGLQLRSQAAVAISAAEIYGSATSKQALTDFFSDCGVKAGGVPPVILPADNAKVDAFSQYPLLANLPPYSPLGVQLAAQITGNTLTGFSLGGTGAYVQKNAQLSVINSAGAATGVNATVSVTNNVASDVKLPATATIVQNAAATIPVKTSAGTSITTSGVATVAAGVLTGVALPSSLAVVGNGMLGITLTGTGNKVTLTVVNGVITAGVLST